MNRQALIDLIHRKKSFLCVGLDPEPVKFPSPFRDDPNAVLAFNRAIIDATSPFCVAYKPNLAFYESLGINGWLAFSQTIEYIKSKGDFFIIADAKRGDIGNTSRMYAETFFKQFPCNAVTVAPYMGKDSVEPFLAYEDKFVILLALTSNAGSADFQMITDGNNEALYTHIIQKAMAWASPDELMFVVGATHPETLASIRKMAPDYFFLVPGVGAQGGSLKEVAEAALTKDVGLLVNSSRGIIYAGNGPDFAERAAEAAQSLQKEMAALIS